MKKKMLIVLVSFLSLFSINIIGLVETSSNFSDSALSDISIVDFEMISSLKDFGKGSILNLKLTDGQSIKAIINTPDKKNDLEFLKENSFNEKGIIQTDVGDFTYSFSFTKKAKKNDSYTIRISNTEHSYEIFSGNVDGEEGVNISDAMLIFRHVAGKSALKGEYLSSADLDGDLSVSIADAMLDFRIVAGKDKPPYEKWNDIYLKDIKFPGNDTKYAVIDIPKLSLKYDLYFGDSYSVLDVGVGQSSSSYIPGYGGTTLVCAHNNKLPNLTHLVSGDVIKIITEYETYTYEVINLEVVNKDNLESYSVSTYNNDLKLYTCYPLDKPANASQRLFVTAKLVSGRMLIK